MGTASSMSLVSSSIPFPALCACFSSKLTMMLKFGDQPPPWELKRQAEESGVAEATNATKNTDPQGDSGPDVPEASKTATNENTIPTVGSISSKPAPAPPHPILKKSRGDSKSGPRPTARFIFPDEDDSKDDGEASSGSVSTANTEQRKSSSPAKSDRKKTSAPAKRFHASIGSKRRPALPRRISSQSSATSEPATREDGGSRHQAGLRLSQPAVESSGGSVSSNASTASQRSGLSAKVAGKRPALKKSTSNRAPGGLEAAQPTSPLHETTRKSALRDRIVEEPSGGPGDTAGLSKLDRTKSTEFSPIGAKTRPRIPRSQSHIEPQRFGMGMGRSLRPTLAAEPTASTTNVAALGTIIDFDKSEMPRLSGSMQPNAERDGYRLPRGPSTTSLLDSRFTPTPPSATPEVPLGRTKSQLTLLLEREKSRLGDKPRSKH